MSQDQAYIDGLLRTVSEQEHHLTELQLFCLFHGLSPERFQQWQNERAIMRKSISD